MSSPLRPELAMTWDHKADHQHFIPCLYVRLSELSVGPELCFMRSLQASLFLRSCISFKLYACNNVSLALVSPFEGVPSSSSIMDLILYSIFLLRYSSTCLANLTSLLLQSERQHFPTCTCSQVSNLAILTVKE